MNYYERLHVPPDATPAEIKTAYYTLAKLFHPDRLQQDSPQTRAFAEEQLKEINQAYAVVGNPAQRALYNATIGHRPPPVGASPTPSEPARENQRAARENQKAQLEQLILKAEGQIRYWEAQQHDSQLAYQHAVGLAERHLWKSANISTLSFVVVTLLGLQLFKLPLTLLSTLQQVSLFLLVISLHEIGVAFYITRTNPFLSSHLTPRGPLILAVTILLPMWGGLIVPWIIWVMTFNAVDTVASFLVLLIIFLGFHWTFFGALLRQLKQVVQLRHVQSNAPVEAALDNLKTQLAQYRSAHRDMN